MLIQVAAAHVLLHVAACVGLKAPRSFSGLSPPGSSLVEKAASQQKAAASTHMTEGDSTGETGMVLLGHGCCQGNAIKTLKQSLDSIDDCQRACLGQKPCVAAATVQAPAGAFCTLYAGDPMGIGLGCLQNPPDPAASCFLRSDGAKSPAVNRGDPLECPPLPLIN